MCLHLHTGIASRTVINLLYFNLSADCNSKKKLLIISLIYRRKGPCTSTVTVLYLDRQTDR
jgi:hypothetical protein